MLVAIFRMFDQDDNGYLNYAETNRLRTITGGSPFDEQVYKESVCPYFKADPGVGLTQEMVIKGYNEVPGNLARDYMLLSASSADVSNIFRTFDRNADGYLSFAEMNELREKGGMYPLESDVYARVLCRYLHADPSLGITATMLEQVHTDFTGQFFQPR